jgi:hypothetical protein
MFLQAISKMASSILLRLPQEVVHLILSSLGKESLFCLRLTSKDINNKVLPSFLATCFEVPCVMLSRPSLQNLLQISRNPIFASAVKGVNITIDHLILDPSEEEKTSYLDDEIQHFQQGGRKCRTQPTHNFFDRPAYDRLFQDQEFFITTGLHTTFLTQALSAFPQLDTITISNSSKPWGATNQKQQTGWHPTNNINNIESLEFVSHVFRVVLSAIVISNSQPCFLNISVGYPDEAIDVLMLRFPAPYVDLFRGMPPSLTSLSIMVSPNSVAETSDEWDSCLLQFLSLFPALSQLGLGFAYRDDQGRLASFSQKLELQELTDLDLDCINCSPEDLFSILYRHKKTLRRVRLSSISFPSLAGWQWFLAAGRDNLSLESLVVDSIMADERQIQLCDEIEGEIDTIIERYIPEFEVNESYNSWTDVINRLRLD